jgi:hypothetical protein
MIQLSRSVELSRNGFEVILERRLVAQFRNRDIAAAGFWSGVLDAGCGKLFHRVFDEGLKFFDRDEKQIYSIAKYQSERCDFDTE